MGVTPTGWGKKVHYGYVVIVCSDPTGEAHHLCLAVYRFPKGYVPKTVPHGNSKTQTPFHPTWPSTMEKSSWKVVSMVQKRR